MWGFSTTSEALNTSLENIFAPESLSLIRNNYSRLIAGEASSNRYEVAAIRKNGEKFYVEVQPSLITYAGKPSIQIAIIDITRRKRIEEELRVILESVPDGITVTDLEGNIIALNEATLHLHGYPEKEEVLGRNVIELISPEFRTKATENLRRTLNEG